MTIAAISAVTSTFASLPVVRLQSVAAPAASPQTTPSKPVNFGPAAVVQLSPQAQSLIASQSNSLAVGQTNNAAANNNATQATTNTASLALTYQSTAEQVWVQVLSSLGLTQQQLDALPLNQRNADEAKAEVLAQAQMGAQVQTPVGVSDTAEVEAISSAVQAVAGA